MRNPVCGCSVALRILLITASVVSIVFVASYGPYATWLFAAGTALLIWRKFPKRMSWRCGQDARSVEQEPIPAARLVRGKEGR